MMVFLIIIGSLLVSVFFIWKIPVWQLRNKKSSLGAKDYAELENEYRKTIAQILGGVYVLAGLLFTWNQLVATQKTLLLEQDRLITDRYSKAIDQLGSDKAQIRLGGMYALDKIAQSAEEYSPIINNVLESYIRENYKKDSIKEELQIAINIITFKGKELESLSSGMNDIDFVGVELKNFNFNQSNFVNAYLTNANLSISSFIDANLNGIQSVGGNFVKSNFTGATIRGSNLYGSDFSSAQMKGVSLNNSNLRLCDFHDADLSDSDLSGADLSEADLQGTILKGANLQNAKGLTRRQIQSAITNTETKLPNL